MIERTAAARVQRLVRWLEPFQRCFGHRAQRLALSTYVYGLLSDSERKSMQAMLARVTQRAVGIVPHMTRERQDMMRRTATKPPVAAGASG